MTDRTSTTMLDRRTGIGLYIGLSAVLILFAVSGIVTYLNTTALSHDAEMVAHTHEVLATLEDVLSLVKDAETGQRGFLITGDERYLEPYTTALPRIDEKLADIERLTSDNPEQIDRIPTLKARIGTKLRELAHTVALRRDHSFDAARNVVMSDRGKQAMDEIRSQVALMEQTERALRVQRLIERDNALRVAVISGFLTCLVGVLLSFAVTYLIWRTALNRQREQWLQTGQIRLSEAMVGDQRLEQLADKVLRFLSEYVDAPVGVFFVREFDCFRRVASYGVPAGASVPEKFMEKDGLLGQAVKDDRTFLLHEVPAGYLSLGSALGQGQPAHLAIVPLKQDRNVNAVVELGFLHPIDKTVEELFKLVSESVGVAIRSATYRSNLQNLLEETQRQAEELQTQGEELRVSNEELEEQGRALKESQARLEAQQAELEQTNVQLEEQAQYLEVQRDEATRTKGRIQVQARELERASQYKSEFLANMSHELRTPLNSSLILAKLLADNPDGNLSGEQVKYAETIQSAGNDLLNLINDILDLSKIEAGHMEVRPESVRLAQLVEDLSRSFQVVAQNKGIEFKARLSPGCPDTMDTDRQRLEQVLKNLISNAIKFTEVGAVTLDVSRAAGDRVAFAVRDTGIGIPESQHQIIFEAFRQADGTTNRKFGGTGLGLSIARELTRLLGGDIHLASEPERGSTFTVTLPIAYDPAQVQPRPPHLPTAPAPPSLATEPRTFPETAPSAIGMGPVEAPRRWSRRVEDDRERLTSNSRVILVVEDDESFARIIYDLAKELKFQCLIATTAEEGIAMAAQHRPCAVVLDVGLPDNSGLSVLDRLKHDARTRHIPVHVISAADHSETAMALGAVGYMMKPVKREELTQAFQRLEARLEQRVRRVLIVEDDPVQLESLRKLLSTHDVETVGAGSAAECLDRLKNATFDCMVLDLSLPDTSGYALLETLSREDNYSFPPVIVYTGRDLSGEEEQRLRRYSKSIIIKGAKSPERLLDEVTLFLHQVVSEMAPEQQRMLEKARRRDAVLEGRRILVVEDDVRNVFALTSILEPRGATVQIARNGREALTALEASRGEGVQKVDLVLMDIMMPEMDGITAMREIRKQDVWRKLPIIALTAKAMKDDQDQCLSAGANDYMAKPVDVEKLLSLVRVWMPR